MSNEEYLHLETLLQEEQLFLSGLICGLRSSMVSSSCLMYIEDLITGNIIWLSTSCTCLAPYVLSSPPVRVKSLGLYCNDMELGRVEKLDHRALTFIMKHPALSLDTCSARSNAYICRDSRCCLYDRTVRFLSGLREPMARFLICQLSLSSHDLKVLRYLVSAIA